MNVKISVFVICVKVIIYLLKYNLHDCTFNKDLLPVLIIHLVSKQRQSEIKRFFDKHKVSKISGKYFDL